MGLKNNLLSIRLKLQYKRGKDFAEYLEITPSQLSLYENHAIEPTIESYYKFYIKLRERKEFEKTGFHLEDLMYFDESI